MPIAHDTATLERFWVKVNKSGPDDCWPWTAASTKGYGVFGVGGRLVYAHRFAYEVEVGPIPENLVIDHLCENTLCVNPAHLEAVPHAVNVERSAGRITHCKNGHPFTTVVTHRDRSGRPYQTRRCLICLNARRRERRRKG
jgi:hypothetical protein